VRITPRARTASLAVVVLLAGVLASDVAGIPGCAGGCKTPTATAAAPPAPPQPKPPVLGISPMDDAVGVSPLATPTAEVFGGRITGVSLVDDWGYAVEGEVSADGTTWAPTERLNFARNYTMTVSGKSRSGIPLTRTTYFSTLVPNNYIHPYLERPGGFALNPDERYGVGTVVIARFDEPVQNKALAERNLVVKTDPPVQGSWYWIDDYSAHWRPKNYYTPGTRVTVKANIFGLELGEGLYGQDDAEASFTIGESRMAVANDITKQVSLFENGKLVRTMPTSMGKGGYSTFGDKTFHWWTPTGVYTVIDKGELVTMDSATYGVPAGTAESYKRKIGYATRISLDGIYLHQLDDTVWAQGNTNVSHGCLNLSGDNARWYFDFVQPGDPVDVRFTGGPKLEHSHNGDWSLSWEQWSKGSALNEGGPAPLAASPDPGQPQVAPGP